VRVFGVSLDSVKDQAKFHEKEELSFALLSDADGSAARKFGVLPKDAKWTKRATFVIDPKGVLRHATDEVDVTNHGDDVLELIDVLKKEE